MQQTYFAIHGTGAAQTVVMVDGKAVSVQIGMNLTIVGSKEAER